MNKTPHIHRNSSSFVRYYGNAMSLLAEALPSNQGLCLFDYPFNELLVCINYIQFIIYCMLSLKYVFFSFFKLNFLLSTDLGSINETAENGTANVATW